MLQFFNHLQRLCALKRKIDTYAYRVILSCHLPIYVFYQYPSTHSYKYVLNAIGREKIDTTKTIVVVRIFKLGIAKVPYIR